MISLRLDRARRGWAGMCLGSLIALTALFSGGATAARGQAAPSMDQVIPLKTALDRLKTQKAQAERDFQASKQKRELAYKGLSDLHRKLFTVGASVQAKRRECCTFDASLTSAKLAGDTRLEHDLNGKKTRADQALAGLEKDFSKVVEDLEKKANEMGTHLAEERRHEAVLRTLDERIYIMEVRKLAAGGTP